MLEGVQKRVRELDRDTRLLRPMLDGQNELAENLMTLTAQSIEINEELASIANAWANFVDHL